MELEIEVKAVESTLGVFPIELEDGADRFEKLFPVRAGVGGVAS